MKPTSTCTPSPQITHSEGRLQRMAQMIQMELSTFLVWNRIILWIFLPWQQAQKPTQQLVIKWNVLQVLSKVYEPLWVLSLLTIRRGGEWYPGNSGSWKFLFQSQNPVFLVFLSILDSWIFGRVILIYSKRKPASRLTFGTHAQVANSEFKSEVMCLGGVCARATLNVRLLAGYIFKKIKGRNVNP